jgi:hypothetical protein
MHLIASFEAIKLLTTLLYSRSIHLTILSQEAVKSILYFADILTTEMGSANLKIPTQTPVSYSHCLTVQSFEAVTMVLSVETMQLILLVWPMSGAKKLLY